MSHCPIDTRICTYKSVSLPCYFRRNSDVGRRSERRLGVPYRDAPSRHPREHFPNHAATIVAKSRAVHRQLGLGQQGTRRCCTSNTTVTILIQIGVPIGKGSRIGYRLGRSKMRRDVRLDASRVNDDCAR